jgi:prepilin signal peptidase PulO-like enzyme (type II secretory pathway)
MLAVLGLMIGSFLGMLTYRLPRGLSILGRSFCDNCHKKISWYDNIPIFSFAIRARSCRSCNKKISFRYPAIELATAILFVLAGIATLSMKFNGLFLFNLTHTLGLFSLPILLILCSSVIALFVIDLETQLLPDPIVYVIGATAILYLLAYQSPDLVTHIFWGFINFFLFLAIYLLTSGRGMGFGDVKLAFVIGMMLGYPQSIVWFLLSFLLGAIIGILLLTTRIAKIGQPIPFGPFLLISALIAAVYGDTIFVWYLNRFI